MCMLLLPLRDGVCFLSIWIWTTFGTSGDKQNGVEVMLYTLNLGFMKPGKLSLLLSQNPTATL